MRAGGAGNAGRLDLQSLRVAAPAAAPTAAILAAVAAPVLTDGGFGDGSRLAFVALAGLALVLASLADPDAVASVARSAPVVALAGLAGLSAVSALWSPADPDDVLRWALVLGGYAALAVAVAATVRTAPEVLPVLAVGLAVLAAICGVWGLLAAAVADPPGALRIGGSWRPAGPFEYPPALAVLQVSMVPALILWMARARLAGAIAAAAGAAIAGSVVALSQSRISLALLTICLLVVPLLASTPGERRRRALAAALVVAAGIAAHLALGGLRSGGPQSDGYSLAAVIVVVAAAAAWALVARRPPDLAGTGRTRRWMLAAAASALVLGGGLALAFADDRQGAGIQPSSGFDHGRLDQWRAAVEVGADEPLKGVGAEAYFLASRDEQGGHAVLYAHNVVLEAFAELGVVGLVLVLVIVAGTIAAAWRARGTYAAALMAAPALAFVLVNLVDWSWHLAGSGAVWAVALGALLGWEGEGEG